MLEKRITRTVAFVYIRERERFYHVMCLFSYVWGWNANRLAGAGLLAPVINYWWPGFPENLSSEAYYQKLPQDQWALRVAHYTPWLTHWWNTQKWFPASSIASLNLDILSSQDKQLMAKRSERKKYVVSNYLLWKMNITMVIDTI